jgi:xanthine dehydrogenase molybdenum-binding subunit
MLDRPNARGERAHVTSAFVREALDRGAEMFRWNERRAAAKQVNGSKVRGLGVAVSSYSGGASGFDGLIMIKPDGRLQMHSGIGNLGTHSVFDCQRVSAEILDVPWDKVDLVWGNTTKNLPWSCVQGGTSTLHAHTRTAWVAGMDAKKKLQQIAAKTFGGNPESYVVANEKVSGNGRSMTLAQAAQKAIELGGIYDGHEAPADINRMTKTAVAGLAGQGLIGVGRDSAPRDGVSHSFVAAFAEVEVDKETGKWRILDYVAVADVGTVIHPHSFGGQLVGRSTLGMAHVLAHKSVYDKHYGLLLATRLHYSRPPTILDIPEKIAWDAVHIPDPDTPVGARGIGEPPVGSGGGVLLSALVDALGDDVIHRAPVMVDSVLTALDTSLPRQAPLVSHI